MNDFWTTIFALAFDAAWVIPAMGVAVAGLAFVVGRHLLVARPTGEVKAEEPPRDNFLYGVTLDRRAAPRRKGNMVEVSLLAGTEAPLHGWVLDRSVGGLCLLLEKPVNPGTVWNVRSRSAPESTPSATVEIKTCRPEKGDWEVGCRFVEPPSWNVLLHFG